MRENKIAIRWAVGAILAISLIAFTVAQQETISDLKRRLLQSEERVSALENMLDNETQANEILRAENDSMRIANQLQADSINFLQEKISSLQRKLKKHQATIAGIQSEMAIKNKQLAQLQAELVALKHNSGTARPSEIKKKEQAIAAVEQQYGQLANMERDEQETAQSVEVDAIEAEMELGRKERIRKISENTQVRYKSIELQKARSAAPLRKIEEDGSNWLYTVVHFNLENTDPKLLEDEYFRLKIIDLDSGEALPYLESNPAYADASAETRGLGFQWSKNPVEAVYINMQAKTGTNYAIKIYFVSDDKEHLLMQSPIEIVRNGKPVQH